MPMNPLWCTRCQRWVDPRLPICPHSRLATSSTLQVNPHIVIAITCSVGFMVVALLYAAFISKPVGPQVSKPANSIASQALDRGTDLVRESKAVPLINIPKLIFRPRAEVEKSIGKPRAILRNANGLVWSEGAVQRALYENGQTVGYLEGRLYQIDYRFPKGNRPLTMASALELVGFPGRAALLDKVRFEGGLSLTDLNTYKKHFPLRQTNPLRYNRLHFYRIDIDADLSSVNVSAVNLTEHFSDWQEDMRAAWISKGMRPLIPVKQTACFDWASFDKNPRVSRVIDCK